MRLVSNIEVAANESHLTIMDEEELVEASPLPFNLQHELARFKSNPSKYDTSHLSDSQVEELLKYLN